MPDDLATRFELRSWGLHPGGPAVASVTVIAKVSGVARQEKLYRVTEAVAVTPVPGRYDTGVAQRRSVEHGQTRVHRPGRDPDSF